MAVSSVTSNIPPTPPPQVSAPPTPPPTKNDNDSDDTNSVQATKAPLPPGQGTRVDQLA